MRRSEITIFISAVAVTLLIGLSSLLPSEIYASVAWHVLWIIIALAIIFPIIMGRLRRNEPALMMHIAFVLMIAGGFCTSLSSRRGTLHLFPSQTAHYFLSSEGEMEKLPFPVTLLSFSPEYYPGMNFPKDFRSEVLVASSDTLHISMNHIGRHKGYRFYQTSYDNAGGTVLTVVHDPVGTTVVYAGFFLFAVGGFMLLVRRLLRSRRSASLLLVIIMILGGAGSASAVPAVSNAAADSIAARQVLFNGNVVPFSTVASRLTYKLTGRSHFGSLSPEAFVESLIKYRDEWSSVPFIMIKNADLRKALNVDGEYASLTDLYDDEGNYIPGALYEGGGGNLDRDILRLDERVAFLADLWEGSLFTPLDVSSPEMRSDFSVKAEILFNRVNPVSILFILSIVLAVGVLSLFFFRCSVRLWIPISVLGIIGIVVYLWLWYVSPGIPLLTTSDMMLFLGICMIVLSSYICHRRESGVLVGLVLLSASFLLLVALLGMKDPVMSPVMPVLSTPWLSVHVSLMMFSYAVLGITLPVALTAIFMPGERRRLVFLAMDLLEPGLYLLGLGIITGAMWANVSWGRYWAWDPKETWALVTMLLYSIPVHRYFRMRERPLFCSLYLVFAFASVIMTYFGVNFLPSLHAYN